MKERIKNSTTWLLICLTVAAVLKVLSIILINDEKYELAVVFIPLFLVIAINMISEKAKRKRLRLANSALVSSIATYLLMDINIDDLTFQRNFIFVILVLTALYLITSLASTNNNEQDNYEDSSNNIINKPLFIIYYLNFSKTYEFMTLINNKFMINVNSETTEKTSMDNRIDIGMKNERGLNASVNSSSNATTSAKILENFEIKNTKSTHLQEVLVHSKEVEQSSDLVEGTLLKFSNVQLTLQDQKENIEMLKLLLGGVFNGVNLKGQGEGMDIEMNLSSMINSLLSECEYQLSFVYDNRTYYITLPLTGNDDFENKYTVNDVLTGKVSIVGIYKGQYERQKPFINTLIDVNNTKEAHHVGGMTSSEYPNLGENDGGQESESDNNDKNDISSMHYVDVLAIIQEVNFDKGDK